MRIKAKLIAWFLLSPLCCCADTKDLSQELASIAGEAGDSASNNLGELAKELLQSAPSLGAMDWRILLPRAMMSMRSANPNARRAGLLFFYIASQTASDLLDPYTEALDGLLKDSNLSFRESIITMLAAEQPRIRSKAAGLLVAHLDDPALSASDAANIVYPLLLNFPADPMVIHKVLNFAQSSSEPGISSNALDGLKFVATLDSAAFNFIEECLSRSDASVEAASIDLIAAKHLRARTGFSEYLHRVAADPKSTQDLRLRAEAALAH